MSKRATLEKPIENQYREFQFQYGSIIGDSPYRLRRSCGIKVELKWKFTYEKRR